MESFDEMFEHEEIHLVLEPLDGSFHEVTVSTVQEPPSTYEPQPSTSKGEQPSTSKLTKMPQNKKSKRRKSMLNSFECLSCGRKYTSKGVLQKHMKKHTSQYFCFKCTQAFEDQQSLNAHNNNKHTKGNLCFTCGKGFDKKANLDSHYEIHKVDKKFLCPFENCGKNYTSQRSLTDHINTRTGNKPYVCEKCQKRFTSKALLIQHTIGCDSAKCRECGQVFTSRTALHDHIQSSHRSKLFSYTCGGTYH